MVRNLARRQQRARERTCVQEPVILEVLGRREGFVAVRTLVRSLACVSAADVVAQLFFAGEESIARRPIALLDLLSLVFLVVQLQLLRV